jgi:hypothetical protein
MLYSKSHDKRCVRVESRWMDALGEWNAWGPLYRVTAQSFSVSRQAVRPRRVPASTPAHQRGARPHLEHLHSPYAGRTPDEPRAGSPQAPCELPGPPRASLSWTRAASQRTRALKSQPGSHHTGLRVLAAACMCWLLSRPLPQEQRDKMVEVLGTSHPTPPHPPPVPRPPRRCPLPRTDDAGVASQQGPCLLTSYLCPSLPFFTLPSSLSQCNGAIGT